MFRRKPLPEAAKSECRLTERRKTPSVPQYFRKEATGTKLHHADPEPTGSIRENEATPRIEPQFRRTSDSVVSAGQQGQMQHRGHGRHHSSDISECCRTEHPFTPRLSWDCTRPNCPTARAALWLDALPLESWLVSSTVQALPCDRFSDLTTDSA